MMFDSDFDDAFTDHSTMDDHPESVILWVLGAVAILLVGLVFGLGHLI